MTDNRVFKLIQEAQGNVAEALGKLFENCPRCGHDHGLEFREFTHTRPMGAQSGMEYFAMCAAFDEPVLVGDLGQHLWFTILEIVQSLYPPHVEVRATPVFLDPSDARYKRGFRVTTVARSAKAGVISMERISEGIKDTDLDGLVEEIVENVDATLREMDLDPETALPAT